MSQKKKKLERKIKKIEVNKTVNDEVLSGNLSLREILKKDWLFLVGLVVLILIVYANSLWGDFVSDDYATILNNPLIADLATGFKELNLVYISNTLIAKIFGVQPVWYHLFSTIFFILINIAAYILCFKLFGQSIARWTVLIFAVHPIHVEAVSWISGKPYLLVTFFMILTLTAMIYWLETGNKKYLLWMIFAYLAAFRSDAARTLILIFLIPLWYLTREKEIKHKVNLIKYWPYFIGILLAAVVFLWPAINSRINAVNSGINVSDGIFYNPFFQYPTAVAKYLQLLLVPVDLTLYHTMFVFPVWLNWAIFLCYLALCGYSFVKDRKMFFALIFIFVASAASMAPVKVGWLVAERYMFFGSLGFCAAGGIILNKVNSKSKYLAKVIIVLIVIVFGLRTIQRNVDWQTNHKLWVNTCQVSPNSHNAWNNIGDDYDKLEQYENSIKGFTQSTVVKPNYADAYHNRANIFFKIGRLDLARESYNIAINYSPGLYQTYLSLIQIDLTEKRYDLAIEHTNKVLQLQPNDPQTHYVAGIVLAQTGQINEAIIEMRTALNLDPDYMLAKQALMTLLSQKP